MKEIKGTVIFEGKKDYADRKMVQLRQVTDFIRNKERGEKFLKETRMVSIVAGNSDRNLFYANKKREAAMDLNLNLVIVDLGENASFEEVKNEEDKVNNNPDDVAAIFQFPGNENLKSHNREIANGICTEKDIDGMNEDPRVIAPVAEAIWVATKFGIDKLGLLASSLKIVVVGAKGLVGTKTIQRFESEGIKVIGIDLDTPEEERLKAIKNADVLISVCNQPDLIHGDMLSEDDLKIGIDASYPHGDFADDTLGRIKVATIVPGGIGPMTIAALMERFVKRELFVAKERGILTEDEVDKLMLSLV